MKKLFLVLAGFLLLVSCENIGEKRGAVGRGKVVDAQYIINHPEEFSKPCMDSAQKDPNKVCTTELKPVCGCNGITYANACKAEIAGVLEFTEGKCSGTKL